MHHIAPLGPVYQAGTLSGNPIAMAAGMATLNKISAAGFYQQLTQKTSTLLDGLKNAASDNGIALCSNQVGAMFGLFFTDAERVGNFEQVMACDSDRFAKFFHGMLDAGVYLAPSAFETGFVSAAHSDDDIANTISAASHVFATLS